MSGDKAEKSAGDKQSAPAPDLDLQAVESISRETLVALLKRKDKDHKTATSKLEKLEERYVKVVRFNKILMEDRTSFQRFCGALLAESDGIFEESSAQETPVNLDALLGQLRQWRGSYEAAGEDRKVFQRFVELVFPGDESVRELFEGSGELGSKASDLLQNLWIGLEDRQNQSIASLSAHAREQMMARDKQFEQAIAATKEAEQKVEEMRQQVTQMAREKAQALQRRMQGSTESPAEAAHNDSGSAGGTSSTGDIQQRMDEEVRRLRDSAEQREREIREAAQRREQELRDALQEERDQMRRLKSELDRNNDDNERQRAQARQMLEQKDGALSRLQQRTGELEQELGSNDFITRLAEQQAGRDAEVKATRRQVEQVNQTMAEIQRLLSMSYSQERVLKERIRELEQSQGRVHVAGDYLKHVVLKYIQYNQTGDLKSQSLVPVLAELLKLSSEERRSVANTAIPQPLLLINQAVGGASTWLRGSGDAAPAPNEPDSLDLGVRMPVPATGERAGA
mmetsp:Transcript_125483/g.354980  ORF Transcript_125483/g.354980 Transcript_125483/m.354980 type:complete len:513 (-) Transcript_125483:139-1677(-)